MKCKFLRLSLLCLLFLFVFCINVSFAYMSSTTATEINSNLYKLYEHGVINLQAYNLTSERINQWTSNSSYSGYTDNYAIVIGKGNTYPSFSVTITTSLSLSVLNFASNNDIINRSSSSSNQLYHNWATLVGSTITNLKGGTLVGVNTSVTSLGSGYLASDQLLQEYLYFYSPTNNLRTRLYSVDKGVEYGGVYLTTPKLTYNNFKTSTISVNYSGENENFIKADYSKNLSSWRLGSFSNFDISEVDTIYGYLASFQGSSDSGAIYSDVVASFQWKKGIGTYSNGLSMPDTSEHALYVNSSRIYYNQGYTLYFNAYKNGDEQEIENQFTYLYFVPLGDTSTSGELINPNANTNLDWDFINSIEHLYDSPSGNTAFIINNYNTSGDILGFTYSDYDQWGFGDFIKVSFNNLLDALYNYDNTSFDLGILGVHNSSEFIVSNNALITIVSLFSNCFLLLSSIAWFFYTICAIGVLDLDKIIKDKADLGLF